MYQLANIVQKKGVLIFALLVAVFGLSLALDSASAAHLPSRRCGVAPNLRTCSNELAATTECNRSSECLRPMTCRVEPGAAAGAHDTCGPRQQTAFGVKQVGEGVDLGDRDLIDTITAIINVLLGLLGIIAVIIVLLGGFKWMTAGGNEDKVGEARKMIFAGIAGLAVILSAFAIAKFVIAQLASATESGSIEASQL
ncbi:MAG: pilin [Patescibacteria group bacterium]